MSSTKNKLIVGAMLASGAMLMTGCGNSQTSQSLTAEARQFQQKGDNKAAVIQLKNALQKNADDGEARLLLGTVYADMADGASAEKELRRALALGIAPERVLPQLGKALIAQDQYQKALDETAPLAAKGKPEVLTVRAAAFMALNQPAQAKEALDRALQAEPTNAEVLVAMARYSLSQKDTEGATKYAEEAVKSNPNNPDVWHFKGNLLRVLNQDEAALAAFDKVLALKPDHRSAHVDKAYIEISTKHFDAAKADLDAARKTTPGGLPVLYTQALLDYSQGKNEAALESLQRVLRTAPEHMPSILLSGAVELNLGSLGQAETHLRKYLENDANSLYARKLLVATLLKSGQTSEAVSALAPVLESGKQDPAVMALAGDVYIQARDYGKATEYLEKGAALAPKQSEIHAALAMSKLGQGDNERAVSELELSSQLDNNSARTNLLLAMTELRIKHFDKALAAIDKLEKSHQINPAAINVQGVIYLAQGNPAKATASFERALTMQPGYFPAAANLAQMAVQDKKPELAKQRLLAVIATDKKNVDALTGLANLAGSQGHLAEMTQWLETAAAENRDAVAPALTLGRHYLQNGAKQKALTLARQLVVANAANPDVLDVLGQAQLANNDAAGALETYSKLVNVVPKSTAAYYRLATVHSQLKNDTEAVADLKKSLSLEPDFLQAQLALAELATRQGNVDQAIALAQQIQKQRAKSPVGYALEGDLLLAQKKAAQALPKYEKAFSLSNSSAALIKVYMAQAQTGKAREGEQRLQEWRKAHPDDISLGMYLADLKIASGKLPEAADELQAVLKQAPDNVPALNNLAWIYQQQKDGRALATAEKAYAAAPESPAVLDTLGWLLVDQGNLSRGLPLLKSAAGKKPDAPDIRYHLASGLAKSGDKAGARAELEAALSSGKQFTQQNDARELLKKL